MASTIRVRAVASGDTTEVQSLIQHPMDSGFVKDCQGRAHPAAPHRGGAVRAWRQDGVHRAVGPGGVEGPLPQVQLQGRQEGRRPEGELGRQQGRVQLAGRENSISARNRRATGEETANAAQDLASRSRSSPARRSRCWPPTAGRSEGRFQGVPRLLHRAAFRRCRSTTSSTGPIRWTRACASSGRRSRNSRPTNSRSTRARRCSPRRSRTARPMATASRTRASASGRTIRYFDAKSGQVITLDVALNQCREANGEKPFDYIKDDMAALTAYMAFTSRGKPLRHQDPERSARARRLQEGRGIFLHPPRPAQLLLRELPRAEPGQPHPHRGAGAGARHHERRCRSTARNGAAWARSAAASPPATARCAAMPLKPRGRALSRRRILPVLHGQRPADLRAGRAAVTTEQNPCALAL